MSTQPKPSVTTQEYLAAERLAETKHEYFDGEVFAMEGASRKHGLIVTSLIVALSTQLRARGKSCEVYPGSLRVKIQSSGLYTYPDVAVVCGKPLLEDEHFDTLLNPTLLIEVLSPSTERYDRGWKADHYRSIETLQELLLIAQADVRVEQYTRRAAHQWLLTEIRGLDAHVELSAVPCVLNLADVYENVLPEPSERAGA